MNSFKEIVKVLFFSFIIVIPMAIIGIGMKTAIGICSIPINFINNLFSQESQEHYDKVEEHKRKVRHIGLYLYPDNNTGWKQYTLEELDITQEDVEEYLKNPDAYRNKIDYGTR